VLSVNAVTAFQCLSIGLFPDPTDCTGYYSCNNKLEATRESCPSHMYFDPVYSDCAPGHCNNPTGAQTTVSTVSDTGNFQCNGIGMFQDPAECTGYYVCNYRGESLRMTCPKYTYFSPVYLDCEAGPCPVTTTTTTTKPTTTTTTTTTQQTTTQHQTTTISTTTPGTTTMHCTSSSDTFADPSDCHKYYRCDVNLKLVSESCLLGLLVYNSKMGGCSIGFCWNCVPIWKFISAAENTLKVFINHTSQEQGVATKCDKPDGIQST